MSSHMRSFNASFIVVINWKGFSVALNDWVSVLLCKHSFYDALTVVSLHRRTATISTLLHLYQHKNKSTLVSFKRDLLTKNKIGNEERV